MGLNPNGEWSGGGGEKKLEWELSSGLFKSLALETIRKASKENPHPKEKVNNKSI